MKMSTDNIGRMFTFDNENWVTIFLTDKMNMASWNGNQFTYFLYEKGSTIGHYTNGNYTEVE